MADEFEECLSTFLIHLVGEEDEEKEEIDLPTIDPQDVNNQPADMENDLSAWFNRSKKSPSGSELSSSQSADVFKRGGSTSTIEIGYISSNEPPPETSGSELSSSQSADLFKRGSSTSIEMGDISSNEPPLGSFEGKKISKEDEQHSFGDNYGDEDLEKKPAGLENELQVWCDRPKEEGEDVDANTTSAEVKNAEPNNQIVPGEKEGDTVTGESTQLDAEKDDKGEGKTGSDGDITDANDQTGIEKKEAGIIVDSSTEPQPAAEDDELTESQSTSEATQHILFDDSTMTIQAFGPVEASKKVQGWTNKQWIAASDKVLAFTSPVLRVMPGRFFWSSDMYEKRILAIYNNPDIILIMRLPKDEEEVRRLLPAPGMELSEQELHAFLVVENIADPKTCKIRLSQLTNPTSVPSRELMQSNGGGRKSHSPSQKNVPRRRSCFDILTPTEVATLSAAFLPDDAFNDFEFTREKTLMDTNRCEDAIVSALTHALSMGDSLHGDGGAVESWVHHVVLGTPHSYVLSSNDQALKDSLGTALKMQKSGSNGNISNNSNRVESIDSRDGSGMTALHYACIRCKASTAQILVNAGADCSVTEGLDNRTPSHISARNLDSKTLSVLLSARPNPNSVDSNGRTPMYIAATSGHTTDGSNNSVALDLCLSALGAWGGQLIVDSHKCMGLLHPVHCVSTQWKPEELAVLLSHCNYCYPLKNSDGSNSNGISASALFHYPIHAALICLRKKVESAVNDKHNEFNVEFMPIESALVKTLSVLLEHGFETNERLEGIVGSGDEIKLLSWYYGFTPLQLLALAAAEAKELESKMKDSGEEDAESKRILKNIMKIVEASAELLLKNGARVNLPSPPTKRRATPAGCYSLDETIENQKDSAVQISRNQLKLERITSLFGGAGRLKLFQDEYTNTAKSVMKTDSITIGTTSLDSDAPGGSDTYTCAICWSEFGVISNRKHLCRTSCRYVCNDCSMKRLVDENGTEHRVSDGQFLLGKYLVKKSKTKAQSNRIEQTRKQRQSVTQSRKALGLKSSSARSNGSADNEPKQTTQQSTMDRISGAFGGIGETRNAVIDRGDKLESLQDKTEALNNASLDFMNMAKELERSQNSWW